MRSYFQSSGKVIAPKNLRGVSRVNCSEAGVGDVCWKVTVKSNWFFLRERNEQDYIAESARVYPGCLQSKKLRQYVQKNGSQKSIFGAKIRIEGQWGDEQLGLVVF